MSSYLDFNPAKLLSKTQWCADHTSGNEGGGALRLRCRRPYSHGVGARECKARADGAFEEDSGSVRDARVHIVRAR